MPRKLARGHKKEVAVKVELNGRVKVETSGEGDLNVAEIKQNTDDVLSEDKNGVINSETFEILEKNINTSEDSLNKKVLGIDKIKETEDTHKNGFLDIDSNLNSKIAPLKQGRKKVKGSTNDDQAVTETVDEDKESLANLIHDVANTESKSAVPDEITSKVIKNDDIPKCDEAKKNSAKRGRPKKVDDKIGKDAPTEPLSSAEQIPSKHDVLEPEAKKISAKRGRPKKVDDKISKEAPTEPLSSAEQIPSKQGRKKAVELKTTEENDEENSSEKQLQANEKIPSKRGRKKAIPKSSQVDEEVNDEKPSEETDEQLQANEKVPSKRGRKKAIPIDKFSDLKTVDEVNDEKVSEETDEQFQANEKVMSKRGRKKAVQSEKSTDLMKIEVEVGEEKLSEDTPDEHEAPEKALPKRGRKKANVPADLKDIGKAIIEGKSSNVTEEQKLPSKRGRPKANQKETVEVLSDKKSDVKIAASNKNAKNKNQDATRLKRKYESSEERVAEIEFNENKVLKVTLQRDLNIDKMFEEREKVTEKGGTKNTKTGNKRANDEEDPKQSGEKSQKISKGEAKSKGQSKKDKMPDVTLLDFSNKSSSPSGEPWNLKISSWNVNGVRAWLEKNGLAYVAHENPDIIAFQETKCSDKMLPKEVNIAGYHSYWLAGDKDGYSGVGLLSKDEPKSVNYGIGIEEHDNEGRVITAEYEAFYFVTAYIPNAGRGLVRLDYRMQWDKDFRSYIKSLDEKKPVILCGDLNVAHEEIDLANPKSNKKNAGFTKEERDAFSTLLSEGFVDSFRHLYPDEKGAYTFWTYMMNARAKNVGWRLDYFVMSKNFTDHLCDSVIRKNVFGSDHCPITLFLCV